MRVSAKTSCQLLYLLHGGFFRSRHLSSQVHVLSGLKSITLYCAQHLAYEQHAARVDLGVGDSFERLLGTHPGVLVILGAMKPVILVCVDRREALYIFRRASNAIVLRAHRAS